MTKTPVELAQLRERVIALLSETELAKVAKAEDKSMIPAGVRFLDLGHLETGIQTAGTPSVSAAADAIMKTSVKSETWHKIQKTMSH